MRCNIRLNVAHSQQSFILISRGNSGQANGGLSMSFCWKKSKNKLAYKDVNEQLIERSTW